MRKLLVAAVIVGCAMMPSALTNNYVPISEARVLDDATGATFPAPRNYSMTQGHDVMAKPTNYDFEDGLTGWTIAGSGTSEIRSGGKNGSYLFLHNTKTATSEAFTVSSGSQVFSYYHNSLGATGDSALVYVAVSPYTSWTQIDTSASTHTNGWALRKASLYSYIGQSVKIQYRVSGSAGFDEGALRRPTGWSIVGQKDVVWDEKSAVGAAIASDGTHDLCVGKDAAAVPAQRPSVAIPGQSSATSAIDSDAFSVPDGYLRFHLRSGELGTKISLLLASESYATENILFDESWGSPKNLYMACDVSSWAGETGKIRIASKYSDISYVIEGGTPTSLPLFQATAGDPASVTTGAFTYGHTDVAIPGKGIPLEFSRSYSSALADVNGALGYGWSHNYEWSLQEFSDGSVSIFYPGGGETFFKKVSGVLTSPRGVNDTLVKNGDSTFTLTTKTQVAYNFSTAGLLTSMIDRNDNETTLTYTDGLLTSVTDPGDRSLDFEYEEGASVANTPTLQLLFTNSDFESANYTGWTTGGTGFGTAPTTVSATGRQGSRYGSSYYGTGTSGNDSLTGTLLSQTFTAGNQIVLLVNGGNSISNLYVSLVLADTSEVLLTTNDSNSNTLKYLMLDTSAYEGQTVQLKVTDNGTGSWGHIGIDYVQILSDATGSYTPSTSEPILPFYNADFEHGSWANWFTTGTAFTARPSSDSAGLKVGTYYGNSKVNGTSPTGTLTSAPFTAGQKLSFGLAGGNYPTTAYATLVLSDGTEVLKTAATNTTDMVTVTWDTSEYMGETVKFRLVDTATGTDGFVRADEIRVEYRARLRSITDPLERVVTFGYDADDNLATITDVKGGESNFTYDDHLMTSLTDSLDNLQNTNIYDEAARVVEQTDAMDGVTCFYYGAEPVYSSENCDGSTYTPEPGETVVVDPRAKETVYQHDLLFRTIATQDPEGGVTHYNYEEYGSLCSPANRGNLCSIEDPLDHVTSYTYDADGNVLTVTDADEETWTYTYNSLNQILTATDPLDRVTEYEYDGDGNLTSVTNALEEETAFDPNPDGTVASITDPLTHQTTFAYDDYGNVEERADALTQAWTFDYDLGGRLLTEADPLSNVTTYTYDEQNNVLTVEDGLGNVTSYEYDAKGQRVSITDATRQPVSTPESGASCGAAGTGDGDDDDSDTVVDDGCFSALFEYDEAGRLISTINALGEELTYDYDANGNRTAMTNTRGKTTTYDYDDANRLVSVVDPLSRETTYVYDDDGRRTSRTDGNEATTAYTYDVLNRLTLIDYPVGTSDVSFTYDELGNRLTMTDGTGTTTYTRDELYRPTSIEDGDDNVVGYDYDAAGRLIELTYPGGTDSVVYDYDTADRLTSVTDWLANETTYTYDNANRLTSTALGNGLTSDRTYDDGNRLLSVENLDGATPISTYDYTLDAVGNRTEMVDTSGTTEYDYDAMYQLNGVAYPNSDTTTYTYDVMGNRQTMVVNGGSTIDYTYDDADQMTDVEGTAYDYDGNGNQTEAGTDTFDWDAENRLVGTEIDSITGSYAYNGDGLRVARTMATNTTTYTWNPNAGLPVILEDSDSNRYIYGLDLLTQINVSEEEWYLYDGLGSTTALTDETGTVTGTYEYDVFGAVRANSGSDSEWAYTGEQTDPSGLLHLRARQYDPSTGRLLSRDPLPYLARYAYAFNNPSNFVDPTGLCGWKDPWNCPDNWADDLANQFSRGTWDQYQGLNSAEQAWCRVHLIQCATAGRVFADAIRVTEQEYGCSQLVNRCIDDQGDAFRHCYWSGSLTFAFGSDTADGITTRHEADSAAYEGATMMDLFNNAAGRWIGAYSNPDRARLRGDCRAGADEGKLIRLRDLR